MPEIRDGIAFYRDYIPPVKETETSLIKLIQQGNFEARNKLVLKHIRFAIFTAKKQNKKYELEDLVQDSVEGMLKAADKVSSKYNNNFTTYASWYIMDQLNRTFEFHESGIKIPREQNIKITKYLIQKEYAEEQNIFFRLNPKLERYNLLKTKNNEEELLNKEDSSLEEDILEDKVDYIFLQEDLQRILKTLPSIESKVLMFHYGLFGYEKKTHREIGNFFGKTGSWSQQLEKKVLSKIKKRYPYLKDYLTGA